ncbi:hypothetical protein E8E11_000086 [Didymella keratinophila]|nr:hypothetical protein E8E11_000086 [Didymella keratinophila]
MSVWQWYRGLTPKTRMFMGVGIMAWAGFGLLVTDQIEKRFDMTPDEKDYEEVRQLGNYIINNAVTATTRGGGIGIVGIHVAQDEAPGRPEAGKVPPTLEFSITEFWSKGLTIKAGVVNPQALAPQLVELVKSDRVKPGCIGSSVIGIVEITEGYRRFNKHLETKVVVRFSWEDEERRVDGATTVLGSQRPEHNGTSEGIGRATI